MCQPGRLFLPLLWCVFLFFTCKNRNTEHKEGLLHQLPARLTDGPFHAHVVTSRTHAPLIPGLIVGSYVRVCVCVHMRYVTTKQCLCLIFHFCSLCSSSLAFVSLLLFTHFIMAGFFPLLAVEWKIKKCQSTRMAFITGFHVPFFPKMFLFFFFFNRTYGLQLSSSWSRPHNAVEQ